jgi:hypothetical protein
MRAQVPEVGPLTILGPPGIERFIRQLHESLAFFLNYPLSFLEWNEGCPEVAYEDDLVRILGSGEVDESSFYIGPYELNVNSISGIKTFKPSYQLSFHRRLE